MVAHAFLAVAVASPLVASAVVIGLAAAHPGQSVLNRALLALLAVAFLLVVTWVALLPPVRQVEVAAARVLLDLDLPDVRRPRDWPSRRRGALWLLLLAAGGVMVIVGLLYLLPLGVGLAAHPVSGADELDVAGIDGAWRTGTGWSAVWLVLPGFLLLLLAAAVVYAVGLSIHRLAPRVIGPSLAERVVVAAERERDLARANAPARELHDSLGHRLTAMTVQATAARRLLAADPGAAERAIAAVEELGRSAQADVDALVGALRAPDRPAMGDDETDLVALVRALVDGTPLDLHVAAPDRLLLPGHVAHTSYRVVQEAITNATRHGAGRAELRLSGAGEVIVEMRNPVAGDRGDADERSGLRGLRERLLLHRGTLIAGREGDTWVLRATCRCSDPGRDRRRRRPGPLRAGRDPRCRGGRRGGGDGR